MSGISNQSLKKNVFLNALRTLMGVIFPLITFPYVSRVLGPEGIGQVHYAQSIVTYFSLIAMLGINTYGLREGAKIRDNNILLTKFFKEMLFISIVSTFVAYILFFLAIIFLNKLYPFRNILLVTSGSILFTSLGVEWLYGAVEDYKYITIRSVFFQFIGLIFLLFFVRDSDDVIQYAALSVITNVGANLLNFIHSKKYINWKQKCKLEIKKHLKPIFVLFGTIVAINVYTVLDSTLLGYICGTEQVGLYNAATKINRIVITMISSLMVVMTPRMSHYLEHETTDFNNLLDKACNINLLLALPSCVGLFFLAKPIIILFCGSSFEKSIIAMRIMSPIIVFITFGQFFSYLIFTPMRKDSFSFIPVIIGALINLVLNVILIPKFMILGACVATVIAEFSVTLTKLVLSKYIGIDIKRLFKFAYQYFIAVIFMGAYLFFINKYIHNYCLLLCVSIFGGAGIYLFILIIFQNEFVKEFLEKIIRKCINKGSV